jgi:hypothetical protein
MSIKRQIILIAILCAVGSAIGGCALMGYLASVMMPPKHIPATFKLTPKGKVLVLVDDLGKPVRYEQIKRLLTENTNRLLLDNKAAETVVSYEDIFRLTARRQDFNRLGISNIARQLGAKQVIYVYLNEFSLKENPNMSPWKGRLSVLVRVVDVDGETKWPIDHPTGHQLNADDTPSEFNSSPAHGQKIASDLADDVALKIARLFYGYTVERGHAPKRKD